MTKPDIVDPLLENVLTTTTTWLASTGKEIPISTLMDTGCSASTITTPLLDRMLSKEDKATRLKPLAHAYRIRGSTDSRSDQPEIWYG